MHRSTKMCSIPQAVKHRVWERDHHRCIVCGDMRTASPVAHYIPRSQLGLGIEENIVTLCLKCHCAFDNSVSRPWMKAVIKDYLQSKYDHWDEENLVYHKYLDIEDSFEKLPERKKRIVMEFIKTQLEEEERN